MKWRKLIENGRKLIKNDGKLMENGRKWTKNDGKWRKIGKIDRKWAKIDRKWRQLMENGRKWQKLIRNGRKKMNTGRKLGKKVETENIMGENGQKLIENEQKSMIKIGGKSIKKTGNTHKIPGKLITSGKLNHTAQIFGIILNFTPTNLKKQKHKNQHHP
jgi:hypothetical protein